MSRQVISCCLIVVAVCFASSCSGGSPGGTRTATAYLPHVDSVELANTYYSSDAVVVTMYLSSQQNPQALAGLQVGEYPAGSWIPGAYRRDGYTVTLRPWITEPLASGELATEATFNLGTNLEAGTYQLRVLSAAEAATGGLSGEYNAAMSWPDFPESMHAVYREYTFTVLPAEE
ncbi:hypothetical protein JW859_08175 [bacterium]|nr:hypothetical protein [bacterium]